MRWMFMGKIVAVMCSPEDNDSSSRIADAFLDGAMGLSTNLIDFYRLSKLRSIQDCCCKPAAFKDKRVIYDDILPILEDIRVADCVVFAAPIYFGGPCGLYKIFEDRMSYFLDENNESILPSGKKALLILTSYYPDVDFPGISGYLSKNLEKFGFEMMGIITYSTHMGKEPLDKNNFVLHKAKEMGLTMRNTPTV